MVKILLVYFLPVIAGLGCLILFIQPLNDVAFPKKTVSEPKPEVRYVENFVNASFFEQRFLKGTDTSETIYLLGSSELSESRDALPYNFITDHFKTGTIGIGHAGNQCFSIYSQLLANQSRLKNAPVVIVLSPGWFHSDFAKGTTSDLFLEFNSPAFLNSIFYNAPESEFKLYEGERIADFYDEIVNPDLSMRLLYMHYQSSRSPAHKALYAPLIAMDNALNKEKLELTGTRVMSKAPVQRQTIVSAPVTIDWEKLLRDSKQAQLDASTNNEWGIENSYYTEYSEGKKGKIRPIAPSHNRELDDLKMLVKLLKANHVNASFIIMPLNPFYYENCSDLDPTMSTVYKTVKNAGFPCLNLWDSNIETYEKGVLADVMHLSDYGWYKADRFIVETYKLAK